MANNQAKEFVSLEFGLSHEGSFVGEWSIHLAGSLLRLSSLNWFRSIVALGKFLLFFIKLTHFEILCFPQVSFD